MFVVDPHLRTPYIYQYNLSLQHDMGANTLLELNYVGSSARKLTSLVQANPFCFRNSEPDSEYVSRKRQQ